jgi:hypothetical protein
VAAAVLLAWVGGLAVFAQRRHGTSEADLLARGTLRLEPATYFYVVSQNGQTIGSASSSIDTTAYGFRSRDIARVRTVIAGDSQSVSATSTAYLSRGFAMDSFSIVVNGAHAPRRLTGPESPDSRALLPSLAPIALMLAHEPRIGEKRDSWIYNPLAQRVERVTLSIAAESLFRVVDSASFDRTHGVWIAAHIDTVRSWKIVTPSRAISAWVDAQGRVVQAEEPGGASLIRTAYEVATLNRKLTAH